MSNPTVKDYAKALNLFLEDCDVNGKMVSDVPWRAEIEIKNGDRVVRFPMGKEDGRRPKLKPGITLISWAAAWAKVIREEMRHLNMLDEGISESIVQLSLPDAALIHPEP